MGTYSKLTCYTLIVPRKVRLVFPNFVKKNLNWEMNIWYENGKLWRRNVFRIDPVLQMFMDFLCSSLLRYVPDCCRKGVHSIQMVIRVWNHSVFVCSDIAYYRDLIFSNKKGNMKWTWNDYETVQIKSYIRALRGH